MSFPVNQSLSLMIPRVFVQWTDEQTIIDIFHQQHIGRVFKVNVIRVPDRKKRSYPIYQAFVYFSAWYNTEIAYNFQQRIFGVKKQARVVYDDPWYWVVFENKKRSLSNNDKRMIRLGYQAYVNDQRIEHLTDRIYELEVASTPIIEAGDAWPTTDDDWLNTDDAWKGSVAASWCDVPEGPTWAPEPEPKAKSAFNVNAAPFVMPKAKAMPAAKAMPEARLSIKHLSEAFAMKTLGDELNLTETAIMVAEAALAEDAEEMTAEWNLTETAFNVAETALAEDAHEMTAELNLSETAISVAEAALKNTYTYKEYLKQMEHDNWEEQKDEMYCCRSCEFDGDERDCYSANCNY
jgi:hypothetical protein